LFLPQDIIAISGLTSCKNLYVEEVLDPWCGTLSIFELISYCLFLYFLIIIFSAFASISPVNKTDIFLYFILITTELSLGVSKSKFF
jgi:hypothetical protein